MNITDIQADKLTKLVALGYKLRKIHSDGVIDVGKTVDGDMVYVFIAADGAVRPPRTHSTMIASGELYMAGIHTVTPTKEA
jgi:hypothetical protein